uniref:Putative reverse transcriptase, RNA-dependent DNA polymerase n=1 Tax=Tanacetum cinerariifolium TaxID=118510 RepID=A0A6L2L9Z2_TANCI|nr:putative reverse transcriptase, RNA-dependent DNA polymerase [Tanacetum cinerariifolium]
MTTVNQGMSVEEIKQINILTRRNLFSLKGVDLKSAQNNVVAKLPLLKQANKDGTSTSIIPGPVTTEEKAQKKNDVKARSMLLMAFPNEHLLTFSQYNDAKTLFEAIQKRFSGNDATNTNEVDTASIQVSVVSTPVSTVSSNDNTANLSDLALLSMRARRYFRKKITINRSDFAGMTRQRSRNQDNPRKIMILEDTSSKAMVAIDGACFDWSYMADDEVPTNMAFMAFLDSEIHNSKTCSNTFLKSFETLKTQYDNLRIEFNKFEFDLATYKRGLAFVEEHLVFYKKDKVVFCDQIAVLKRDTLFRDSEMTALNLHIEKLNKVTKSNQIKIDNFENASKSLDKLIGSLFAHPSIDLSNSGLEEFWHLKFKGYGPKDSKSVYIDTSNEIKKALDAPIIKDWVFDSDEDESEEMVLKSDNVQPEQANQPRKGNVQREVRRVWNNAMRTNHQNFSNSRRNFTPIAVSTKSGMVPISTGRQNSLRAVAPVSAARPINNTASKPLGTLQDALKDQGYFNSRCSRHMTGNISYLTDFKEHDEGYVTFGGGAKGGKITCKGTIRTGGGPEWLFDIDALSKSMNYAPVSAGTNSKDFTGKGASFDTDIPIKDKHDPSQASKSDNHERHNAESSIKIINTAGTVNTTTPIYSDYPNDPLMPNLKDAKIFDDAYDDRDEGAKADYNNLKTIMSEVYVSQPPSFMDPEFPDIVYKVEKALYGLHQALRACVNSASTPMETHKALSKDASGTDVNVYLYSDYAGANIDRKSTTRGCHFLGSRLISWQCKKQTIMANSTTKAKYPAASNCCGQVLWLQNQLLDYGYNFMQIKIHVDNERLKLKGYLINDGYADLVQHVGDYFNTADVFLLGVHQHNKWSSIHHV